MRPLRFRLVSLSARMLLAAAASLTCGCTATPEREAENLASAPPLPYAIRLQVNISDEGSYGSQDEWRDALSGAFETTAVGAVVLTTEQGSQDITVAVDVGRSDDRLSPEAEINVQGAVLDFLAWSTIPFLPLWIPDIDVRAELGVKVRFVYPREAKRSRSPTPIELPTVKTCHLERHAFWSWPTVGALLLPPFVFRSPQPERLQETIALAVRRAVADEVAITVKSTLRETEKELLHELTVKRRGEGWVLMYRPDPNCSKLTLRVESADSAASVGRSPKAMSIDMPYSTKPLPPTAQWITNRVNAVPAGPLLLRIEATGRNDNQRLGYTIPFNTLSSTPRKPSQLAAKR